MTIRGTLRLIVLVPLLLLLVLFLLSNTEPVKIGLFPTDISIELSLSIAILAALGIGFLLGALVVWFTTLHFRGAARRAEEKLRLLEAKPPAGPGQSLARPL